MFAILASIVSLALAQAPFVGFSRGNTMLAVPVEGQVRVTCDGFNGNGATSYECRDVVLEPSAYDYFVGPRGLAVSKVELISMREDRSTRTKAMGYNAEHGSSSELINLWIASIFQKPLLSVGKNTITYRLYSSRDAQKVVAEGTFQVSVQRGESRQCPVAHYVSHDSNDCSSQYSICQKYFTEFNNCK